MPGMNQLGGAQTVTQTTNTPQNPESQPAPSTQADAGVQVVPDDAVQGLEDVKGAESESSDQRSRDAQREQRKFSQLANGRRRRVDERTGAVIELSKESDIRAAEAKNRDQQLAEVEEQNRQAALSNKDRLEKAIAGDLFAKPFKVQAEAKAVEKEAVKPVEAASG